MHYFLKHKNSIIINSILTYEVCCYKDQHNNVYITETELLLYSIDTSMV